MEPDVICNALGNKIRYQIIMALREKSISSCCPCLQVDECAISVGDTVKFTGLAQSTVSQHLAVLEKANLIRKEKRELYSCYFLNEEVLSQFMEQLKTDLL